MYLFPSKRAKPVFSFFIFEINEKREEQDSRAVFGAILLIRNDLANIPGKVIQFTEHTRCIYKEHIDRERERERERNARGSTALERARYMENLCGGGRVTQMEANYPVTWNHRNHLIRRAPDPRYLGRAENSYTAGQSRIRCSSGIGIWAKDGPLHSTQLHTARR